MADTSYSDMSSPDNRGAAVSAVSIMSDGSIHVEGCLQDAQRINYTLAPNAGCCPYEVIGRTEPEVRSDGSKTEEQRFVKARLDNGELLLCHVNGFKNKFFTVPEADVREILEVPPKPIVIDRRSKSSELWTSFGDEMCIGCDEDFASAREMLLKATFQTIDKNQDGVLTVFELGKAISEEKALLKVLAGTGYMRPSAEDALKALQSNDETPDDGVTEQDFVTIFKDGIGGPAYTSSSRRRAQKLAA